jgi:hypothetical protein
MLSSGPPPRRAAFSWRGFPMADLAYVLLAIAGFALLFWMMRGLDSL